MRTQKDTIDAVRIIWSAIRKVKKIKASAKYKTRIVLKLVHATAALTRKKNPWLEVEYLGQTYRMPEKRIRFNCVNCNVHLNVPEHDQGLCPECSTPYHC